MCRNLFIAGIKADKQDLVKTFMIAARPFLTTGNDDGVGYSAITEKGIFGERWLDVNDAFDRRLTNMNSDGHQLMVKHFKDDLQTIMTGDKFSFFEEVQGAAKSPMQSVIMHARAATNKICIENTHPFYRKGVAMTHNGVISNDDKLTKIYSTCDSEVILNSYVDNDVANNPDNIKEVGKALRGSYAVGVLTRDKDKNPIMDIFRSSPLLYMTHVKELDAIVICTSLDVIDKTLDELKWERCEHIFFQKEKMLRINAVTGEFISKHEFVENGFSYGGGSGNGGYNRGYPDKTYVPYMPALYPEDNDNVSYLDRYRKMSRTGISQAKKDELDHICEVNGNSLAKH